MRCIPWESWEEDFLREVSESMPMAVICEKLERTPKSVIHKATRIDVHIPPGKANRPWTRAEVSLFCRLSTREISKATSRSISSVKTKRLRLQSSEWSEKELDLFWKNNNAQVAEITGRTIEEVALRRERWNIDRNPGLFKKVKHEKRHL